MKNQDKIVKILGGNHTIPVVFSNKEIKISALYTYKKGRRASLKRKPFIQPVALKERQRIAEYFVNSAERMLKKIMK